MAPDNYNRKDRCQPVGKVRRTQLISTYGVGSILPMNNVTYMVAGLDHWDTSKTTEIFEPRLTEKLGRRILMPPASGDEERCDVPVFRFPEYYFCGTCHRIDTHDQLAIRGTNRCAKCNVDLIPSRFIVICENGHASDFPYYDWVHENHPGRGSDHMMSINAMGVNSSLSDIKISCICGASRTMVGAFGEKSLGRLGGCTGYRPWLDCKSSEICAGNLRTVQRGASNVYFPNVISAISIPPWSDALYQLVDQFWNDLFRDANDDDIPAILRTLMKRIPEEERARIDESAILKNIRMRKSQTISGVETGDAERDVQNFSDMSDYNESLTIRREEYLALLKGKRENEQLFTSRKGLSENEFVCVAVEPLGKDLAQWFDSVMQVKRLREVRVLTSFNRVKPNDYNSASENRAAKLSDRNIGWLPGTVIRGEGVFIQLNGKKMREWECNPLVMARANIFEARLRASKNVCGQRAGLDPSARYIMLHTLAHILINQWALESGYSASNLRERLYVCKEGEDCPEMRGILIYTATSDAAGSLGGLVSMAKPERLYNSLVEGIARASWCSNDPLCIETEAGGTDSLNLAACHACVLLPETSCEQSNLLLDRAFLTGKERNDGLGFFEELLK